jgi:hypothetical protein
MKEMLLNPLRAISIGESKGDSFLTIKNVYNCIRPSCFNDQ